MQNAMKFWDGIAPKYAKSPIRDMDAYEYSLGRTRSYLKETDQVLELGCGTGSTALKLAGDVAEITATDLSDAMLDVGRTKARAGGTGNVRFERADVSEAPDGPYDVVMALNLLHLLEDTDAALAGVSRRLKPGGLFISKTPCGPGKGAPLKYRLMLLVLPLMQMLGKAPYVKFMSSGDWDAAIIAAGFKIVETGNYPANPPSRYIVARKEAG